MTKEKLISPTPWKEGGADPRRTMMPNTVKIADQARAYHVTRTAEDLLILISLLKLLHRDYLQSEEAIAVPNVIQEN